MIDPRAIAGALRERGIDVDDGATARAFHTDFGGTTRMVPAVVARARTAADVAATLRVAGEASCSVSVRGAAHSCRGQTLNQGGIVLEYFSNEADPTLLDETRVRVSASSRWSALEAKLNAGGRACAVLTDCLGFSVGGTLSVGGYGLASIKYGSQADQVESLELVTMDGVTRTCSREENRELFELVLCGVGQLGVIASVVMRVTPRVEKRQKRWYQHDHPRELCDVIRTLDANAGAPIDEFKAVIFREEKLVASEFHTPAGMGTSLPLLRALPMRFPTSVGETTEGPFDLEARVSRWVYEGHPDHVRVWTDYKFSGPNAIRFLTHLMDEAQPRAPENIYVLAIRKPALGVPLLASTAHIDAPLAFSVGTYHMIKRGEDRDLAAAKDALRVQLTKAVELEGRPYLYGFNALDAAMKERIFGRDLMTRVATHKRALDPQGLLNPNAF